MTSEKKKVPYWFDERHKCWLRLCEEIDLTSTNPIDVWIATFPRLQDFHTHRQMCLNTSDIEFFNINPNDNLNLNMEYYKSLHRYKWRMNFSYNGNENEPGGVYINSTNRSGQIVFVF